MKRHRKRKLREAKIDANYTKKQAFFIWRRLHYDRGYPSPKWWLKYARRVMRLQA